MKTLFISVATAALLLNACSSNKTAETPNPVPQISAEEAITQCRQAAGENTDRAAFDACMKDKGFQRKADGQAPADAAAAAAQ
ncbi:hypothetical protein [Neisseria iguanae]|uniref:Entry exclusion lipoprotein TrbK n=1 Tax=Neisseria iguanae TaxID=90242 RepID=A0A2P7TZB9_9NEIS|nr:hypothetical protein [Neisseria iguanae]PSJ80076.1 hypothetical protein C7N83_08485 [Neisseria iguanae]